ncbi:hypothetical protein ElyMa_001466500, partial [Elysia marginata]
CRKTKKLEAAAYATTRRGLDKSGVREGSVAAAAGQSSKVIDFSEAITDSDHKGRLKPEQEKATSGENRQEDGCFTISAKRTQNLVVDVTKST